MGQLSDNLTWEPCELNFQHKTKNLPSAAIQHSVVLLLLVWVISLVYSSEAPTLQKSHTFNKTWQMLRFTSIQVGTHLGRSSQSHIPDDITLVQKLSAEDDITLNDITPAQDQHDFAPSLKIALPRTPKPSLQ